MIWQGVICAFNLQFIVLFTLAACAAPKQLLRVPLRPRFDNGLPGMRNAWRVLWDLFVRFALSCSLHVIDTQGCPVQF